MHSGEDLERSSSSFERRQSLSYSKRPIPVSVMPNRPACGARNFVDLEPAIKMHAVARASQGTHGEADIDRKVLLIYCGGTLGMHTDPVTGAFQANPGFVEHVVQSFPQFENPKMPILSFTSFDPPLDSSDMQFEHYTALATTVAENMDEYHGIVIAHGTDTMAWSASALSFSLENLRKPVVFTGAQLPLEIIRSDALTNLIDSCIVAAYSDVPEVMVVFDSNVFRGNRCTKSSCFGINGFSSYNYPRLGNAGTKVVVNPRRHLPMPTEPFSSKCNFHQGVVVLKLFPGVGRFLAGMLNDDNIRGVVLEAFGSGDAPSYDGVVDSLDRVCKAGVVVVVVTNCQEGHVILETYNAGLALKNAGATSGGDMTTEAAFTKLSWLLANEPNVDRVRALMSTDLRGEMSLLGTECPEGEAHTGGNPAFRHRVIF